MDKNQIDTSGRELGKYTKEDLLVPVEIAFNEFSIHDAHILLILWPAFFNQS